MEKKSLISTLKTTKKANVASTPATNQGVSTRKAVMKKAGLSRGPNAKMARIS
jgi:hypothetical protein